jgi:RNA polymerase sigma-54 factor
MLQENPLLEKADGEDEAPPGTPPPAGTLPTTDSDSAAERAGDRDAPPERTSSSETREDAESVDRSDFEDYSSGDSDWGSGNSSDDDDGFFPQQVAASSLRDHLLRQLAELNLPLRDRQIVASLIDALDDDGYLTARSRRSRSSSPMSSTSIPTSLDRASLRAKLRARGIGARRSECLMLQLKALPATTPLRAEAMQLVAEHLPLLAARDFTKLKRLLHCDDTAVRAVRALIMSLSPRPGASFAKSEANYVIPDVVVRKYRGKWTAALNEAAMPKLRLNRIYADILTRNRDTSNQQLAAQLQEAKWLIRNVQQRFETILRVAQAIVERQRRFFEHGDVAMRPMVLREIADMLTCTIDDLPG